MAQKLKILHLEDMPTDAELVDRELKRSDLVFDKLVVDNKKDYQNALEQFKPDIILSDHSLPSFNSQEALVILKNSHLNIPFILITATISEEFAVEIMKAGATDYILKDRMQRLPTAVNNAIEKYALEAERERANQELNMLFNTIDDVFFSRDMVNNIMIQISPACEAVYGYKPEDFIANPNLCSDVMHPDDKLMFQHSVEKFSRGETVIVQYRIFNKAGHIRWVESKIIPTTDSNGTIKRIYGVIRDVTDSKMAEIEIQQNQIKLLEASQTQAAILNALPPNVVLINEKGKIIAVNESWKRFTINNNLGMPNFGIGYSYLAISEKATGVDKINNSKIAKGISDIVKGIKKEFTLEYACFINQKTTWYQVVVSPIANDTHKGAVILHIDITDRKKAEESLVKSEASLRSVFENTNQAILLFDTELKIVSFNTNAREQGFASFHKKLKVGASAFNYFPKERKNFIKQILKRVNNGETIEYEIRYLINDVEQWYKARWLSVMNPQKESIGVITTLENITEKKLADMERDKMTADLVQRNKDLEQFTYIVSHNLRAPVANIRGLSNLLSGYELNEMDSEETLQALSQSVINLDNVIIDLNHILQISKQINDQIVLISLPELLEEIRLGISRMIRRKNVTIYCQFDAISEIYSIKSYLYSIFQNLVINSIKYRRADVDPEILISSQMRGDKIQLCFKDNGKGIDLDKNAQQLFGLYKRFDTSVEGKGMGLFMVKLQAESLGGNVTVKSKLNEGTEFTVELPIRTKERY